MFPLNIVVDAFYCLCKCYRNRNKCCCCCCSDNDNDSKPPSPTISSAPLIRQKGHKKIKSESTFGSVSNSKTTSQMRLIIPTPDTIDAITDSSENKKNRPIGSAYQQHDFQFFTPTTQRNNIQMNAAEIVQEWQSYQLQRNNDFNMIYDHNANNTECIKNAEIVCLSIRRLRFVMIWYNMYDMDEYDVSNSNGSNNNGNMMDNNIKNSMNIIDFICNGINYSFIELINDFLHFKQYHFNYKFNPNILNNIYSQFINTNIQCGDNNKEDRNNMFEFCMAKSRNMRNRYECNENVYKKLEVYGMENIDSSKNKQDLKLILMIYLDCIHVYIFHSYLLNEITINNHNDDDDENKTNFPIQEMQHDDDDDDDGNNDENNGFDAKFITEIKDYEYNNNDDDDEADDDDNNNNIYSFGCNVWQYDGTQYFYAVYNDLKDELLHNELYRLSIHEWDDTYKQCLLYTKCTYYKNTISHRDSQCKHILGSSTSTGNKRKFGKNYIEKGEELSINSLMALSLYCNYNNIRNYFKSSIRCSYKNERGFFIAKRHREYYHLSKILLSTVQSFANLINKNIYLYHSLTKNIFNNNNNNNNNKRYINFKFPISCTPIQSIAKEYLNNIDNGILMKLSSDNKTMGYMMDTSWFSEYPQEFEYLFYDINICLVIINYYELNINNNNCSNDTKSIISSNIDGIEYIGITDDIFANMIEKFNIMFGINLQIDYTYNKNKKYIDQNICDIALLQIICRKMYINITNMNHAQMIFTEYMLEQFDCVSTEYNQQITWNNIDNKKQYNLELINFINDLMWNKYLWIRLFPKVSIFIFNEIGCNTLEFINTFLNQLQNGFISNETSIINEVQIKGIQINEIQQLIQLNYAQYFQQFGWSLFLPQINNDNISYSIAWRKIHIGFKRQTAYNSVRLININDDDNQSQQTEYETMSDYNDDDEINQS